MAGECTFFQTLEDHVTQPVLFIPETHLSCLQRMVGLALIYLLAGNSPLIAFCVELIVLLTSKSLEARDRQGKKWWETM